jgi:hypothetical protein
MRATMLAYRLCEGPMTHLGLKHLHFTYPSPSNLIGQPLVRGGSVRWPGKQYVAHLGHQRESKEKGWQASRSMSSRLRKFPDWPCGSASRQRTAAARNPAEVAGAYLCPAID